MASFLSSLGELFGGQPSQSQQTSQGQKKHKSGSSKGTKEPSSSRAHHSRPKTEATDTVNKPMENTWTSSESTWECSTCTFKNEPGATTCEMCGSAKPANSGSGMQPPSPPQHTMQLPPTNTLDEGLQLNNLDITGQLPQQHTEDVNLYQNILSQHSLRETSQELQHQHHGGSHMNGSPYPYRDSQPNALQRPDSFRSQSSRREGSPSDMVPPQQRNPSTIPHHTQSVSIDMGRTQAAVKPVVSGSVQQQHQHSLHLQSPCRTHGSFGSNYRITGGMLRVRVLRAFDLRNTDLGILDGDASDPFVVAKVGRQEFKTEVVNNNLNPVWNSSRFEFAIENESDQLVLEVFAANQWHASDNLGKLEVRIQDLVPGENQTVLDQLNEGGMQRENGRVAKLEVEVKFLSPEELAGCRAGTSPVPKQNLGAQQRFPTGHGEKTRKFVPLPSFRNLGPEAFMPPPRNLENSGNAPIGEMRKMLEYESQACRLGQYDYSAEAVYYPKQDETDKRRWKEDPFYGWRRELAKVENHTRPRKMLSDTREQSIDEQGIGLWQKDPFHGWLRQDIDGHVEQGLERKQEARASRQLMSLPSFREAPVKRFEDHREYADTHEVQQRQRRSEDTQRSVQPKQCWRDDAFFGWLPGRGPDTGQKHLLHRPLEQARLNRLPSFSEQAMLGISGHGIGILSVWINCATNLTYSIDSGLRGKPSACVKLRLISDKQEFRNKQITPTVATDANPCWNTPAMIFEVGSKTDELVMEVMDLANCSKERLHQSFLGRVNIGLEYILDRVEEQQSPDQPLQFKEVTLDGSQMAQIDFECLYEPFDTERYMPQRQPESLRRPPESLRRPLPSRDAGGSFRSTANADGTQLGILSLRIISASNLVNMDTGILGDVSDPYVTARLTSQGENARKRTHTINNDLNPVWNMSSPWLFPVTREDDQLVLEVFDEDMLTSDDFLGRLIVPLYRIICGTPNRAVRIRDRLQDIQHGELEVEIGFSPD